VHGNRLYDDVDGVYLKARDTLDPSSSGARLGIDWLLRKVHVDGYRRATITARVQDCESARACVHASVDSGEIVMIMGYCHSYNGAYLAVKSVRLGRSAKLIRQVDAMGAMTMETSFRCPRIGRNARWLNHSRLHIWPLFVPRLGKTARDAQALRRLVRGRREQSCSICW